MTRNIKAVENTGALTPEENSVTPEENSVPIAKPGEFNLDKFKAKRTATVANVETLPSPLPVHNMAAAKDFVRLHPDEENYWSAELCFMYVPIKGQKNHSVLKPMKVTRTYKASRARRCRFDCKISSNSQVATKPRKHSGTNMRAHMLV